MKQNLYNKIHGENTRGAFRRIAEPYSGAAPRGVSQAKLVRGVRASKLASLAKNL